MDDEVADFGSDLSPRPRRRHSIEASAVCPVLVAATLGVVVAKSDGELVLLVLGSDVGASPVFGEMDIPHLNARRR